MLWTYEDPINIPKDEVRLTLGDTNKDYPILYDEEIQFFLKKAGDDVSLATYESAKCILAKFSLEPNYSIGPESVNSSAMVQNLRRLVKDLKPAKNAVPTPPTGTHTFRMGMMDNGAFNCNEEI